MTDSNLIRIIYLDWNVIVYLMQGDYPKLLKAINYAKSDSRFVFPFTSEHVDEATNIRSKIEQLQRLDYLSDLSANIYFENSVLDFGLVIRHPAKVYKTLNEVWLPKGLTRWFGNIISRPILIIIRKMLKLNPKILNNIPPSQIWDEIDSKILNSKYANKFPEDINNSPIRGLLKINERSSIKYFGKLNEQLGASASRAFGSDMKIASLYSMLETFGYYPEKKKVYEKASRFADASHCYYSQWAEICISRDKGFRMKSQAIASLTNSSVKYIDPANAHHYINKLVAS